MNAKPRRVPSLDAIEYRRIALAAEVAEKTLRRALAGEPIRPLSRLRIARALELRGLLYLLPDQTEAAS